MIANIWDDEEVVLRNIEITLSGPSDSPKSRQWAGTFTAPEDQNFEVEGRYRLELEGGKSADIVLTNIVRRELSFVVDFRVIAWKGKPRTGERPARQSSHPSRSTR